MRWPTVRAGADAIAVLHTGGGDQYAQQQARCSYCIRDWARQNGFELADRGRIAAHIIEAFEEAHTAATKTKKGRRKAKEPAFSA